MPKILNLLDDIVVQLQLFKFVEALQVLYLPDVLERQRQLPDVG